MMIEVASLHMEFRLRQNSEYSNIAFKNFMMRTMHETAKRLLDVGIANGLRDFTSIARTFGASDQSATNWKTRGVPQAVVVKAAALWSVNPAWLAGIPGAKPTPLPKGAAPGDAPPGEAPGQRTPQGNGRAMKEPTCPGYCLSADELTLLAAYRSADSAARGALMWVARKVIESRASPGPE